MTAYSIFILIKSVIFQECIKELCKLMRINQQKKQQNPIEIRVIYNASLPSVIIEEVNSDDESCAVGVS